MYGSVSKWTRYLTLEANFGRVRRRMPRPRVAAGNRRFGDGLQRPGVTGRQEAAEVEGERALPVPL